MDKKKILFIGVGAAGNKIVNEFLKIDSRYRGLFVNTTSKDLEKLEKANLDSNVFLIPNADGTGKNRDKAKDYVKDDLYSLMDVLNTYKQQNTVYVVFSMGGGTGSGISPLIPAIFAQRFPDKTINMIGVKPSLRSSKKVLNNSLECWNDLMKMKKLVNSFMFVDNDKNNNEEEINKAAVKEFDDLLNVSVASSVNVIDSADLNTILSAKGSTHFYQLDDEYADDIETALNKAVKKSMFIEPESRKRIRCEYLGVSLHSSKFKVEDVEDNFRVREDSFYGNNDKYNFVIMSGCSMPFEMVELIEEELKERKTKNQDKEEDEKDLMIKLEDKPKEEKKTANISDPSDLNDIMNLIKDI